MMARWILQDSKITKNLKLAHRAIDYVKSLKIHSSNLPHSSTNDQTYADSQIDVMRNEAIGKISKALSYDRKIAIHSKISIKYHVGNCFELSSIAYSYLKYTLNKRKIDLCKIVNGDHAFVVIGRQDDSLEYYKTWGPKAVVCDPWSNNVFLAIKIDNLLNDWDGYNVRKFNPNKQSITFYSQDRRKLPALQQLKAEVEKQKYIRDGKKCITYLKEHYEGKKNRLGLIKRICERHESTPLFFNLLNDLKQLEEHKAKKKLKL